MPVSNSVIRRYTPPTCTLEVLAQSSALSQWMGKSVLKQLEFELRFDDPRLPEEKRIAIKGDSDQLEALCAVVTNYVQEFLQMSPESFWANFSRTHDASFISDEPEERNFNNSSLLETQAINSFTHRPVADIHIKPSTHLTHNLFLGSLANPASGPVIELSLLQLFDLATALDEYSADVMALPNLTPRRTRSRIPTWAPVAAVLVVAVGLAPLTWQYANQNRQKQTAKKPTAQQNIALESSPQNQPSSGLPTFAPPDSLPSQSLPPLGSPLQVPNSTASPPAIAQTLPSVPGTPQIPATSTLPSASQTSPSLGNVPTAPLPSLGTTLNIPGTPKAPTLSTSPLNTEPKPKIAIQSQPRQNSTALTSIPKSRTSSALEQQNSIPSNLPSTGNISPDISNAPPPLATLPNPSSGASREPSFSQPGTSEPSATDTLITRLREARRNRGNLPTEVATTSSDTLFDTAQVAQAREKLKKGWQPPSGLSQSIEYSLVVAVDGSIEQILPLGKAARDFVDRTGMPLIGEPFVSPNKNGQSVKIRAVFSPDGKVQTFPEKE
ncbi:hypothetical protein NIES4073_04450 [Kalymmatonema gypsitolerans NIES-4073]|nr:hypothetical protein NIES4073_04450 [Scytonema sp. NIES-4073]